MRIAIYGTGGVGGYFGGRLAQAGEDVVFIARGEHLRAIQANGLQVASIKGDFVIQPTQATDNPAEIGNVDVVLVATKAWQVPEIAESIHPMLGAETFVVPLENGIEAPAQLIEVLGAGHVLGGLCRLISYIEAPGKIRHAGAEPSVMFGELDKRPSERAERLRQAFERAQVKVSIPDDIQVAMWDKFLFISAASGVGAITRVPVGIFRQILESRQLLLDAMQEIYQVAQGHGVALPENVIAKNMSFVDNLPIDGTMSMQRDIMEGRPSELEAQNGAVVRLGQKVNVPTPTHTFIYQALLPLEKIARGEYPAEL